LAQVKTPIISLIGVQRVKYLSLAKELTRIDVFSIKSAALSFLKRGGVQGGFRELAFDYSSLPYLSS
jgi:hypothetical protein